MAKGYIDLDTFRKQNNYKEKVVKCPRCHQPMKTIMTNRFGKNMCINCFIAEEEKYALRKKRPTDENKKDTVDIEEQLIEDYGK